MCIIKLNIFTVCGHIIPAAREPCRHKPAGATEEYCVVINYHYEPIGKKWEHEDTGPCSLCLAAKLAKLLEPAYRREREEGAMSAAELAGKERREEEEEERRAIARNFLAAKSEGFIEYVEREREIREQKKYV